MLVNKKKEWEVVGLGNKVVIFWFFLKLFLELSKDEHTKDFAKSIAQRQPYRDYTKTPIY